MRFKKIIIYILLGGIIISCKKYPEDTATIHLRTAKRRLTQLTFWTDYAENTNTGVNYSGIHGDDYIYFNKNGNFIGEHSVLFNFNGKWEFENKKNNLHIYNEVKSFSFEILQLDAEHLYMRNDSIRCKYHNIRQK